MGSGTGFSLLGPSKFKTHRTPAQMVEQVLCTNKSLRMKRSLVKLSGFVGSVTKLLTGCLSTYKWRAELGTLEVLPCHLSVTLITVLFRITEPTFL